jgi:hypothetical protein
VIMIGQEEFDLSSGKKLNCIGKFAPEKSCFLLNSVANRRQTKKVHRAPMKFPSLAQPNLGRCTIMIRHALPDPSAGLPSRTAGCQEVDPRIQMLAAKENGHAKSGGDALSFTPYRC